MGQITTRWFKLQPYGSNYNRALPEQPPNTFKTIRFPVSKPDTQLRLGRAHREPDTESRRVTSCNLTHLSSSNCNWTFPRSPCCKVILLQPNLINPPNSNRIPNLFIRFIRRIHPASLFCGFLQGPAYFQFLKTCPYSVLGCPEAPWPVTPWLGRPGSF